MTTNTDPVTPAIPAPIPATSNNTLIFTFLTRNWLIIALAIGSLFVFLNEEIFQKVGPLVWMLLAITVGWVLQLLLVHIFFRSTIDKDVHDGTYIAEWRSLTPTERMRLTVQYRAAVWIGVAIIIAGCVK